MQDYQIYQQVKMKSLKKNPYHYNQIKAWLILKNIGKLLDN